MEFKDYSTWTFEELYNECIKREILGKKIENQEGLIWKNKVADS